MKTTILILLTAVSIARANLIDLTPGGFDLGQPWPVAVEQFFGRYGPGGMQNIAGANIINGQVVWSPFTVFGDDHFDLTLNGAGTIADVGWDLIGTGFRGLFVFTESNELIANLYFIPGGQRFAGIGSVEIDGTIPVDAVTFAGTNKSVPDNGSTLALMASGLLGLVFYCLTFNITPRTEGR